MTSLLCIDDEYDKWYNTFSKLNKKYNFDYIFIYKTDTFCLIKNNNSLIKDYLLKCDTIGYFINCIINNLLKKKKSHIGGSFVNNLFNNTNNINITNIDYYIDISNFNYINTIKYIIIQLHYIIFGVHIFDIIDNKYTHIDNQYNKYKNPNTSYIFTTCYGTLTLNINYICKYSCDNSLSNSSCYYYEFREDSLILEKKKKKYNIKSLIFNKFNFSNKIIYNISNYIINFFFKTIFIANEIVLNISEFIGIEYLQSLIIIRSVIKKEFNSFHCLCNELNISSSVYYKYINICSNKYCICYD